MDLVLSAEQIAFLRLAASRYVWWKTVDEAMVHPHRVIAQVMNIGEWDSWCELCRLFSSEEMCGILSNAEIGEFSEKSWVFWHTRLSCASGIIPPLPRRNYA